MRVSVIPTDKIIIIDGNGIELENWSFDDGHIHAIQWMHDKGHIELKTTEPNIEIDDISFVQPYIDAYTKTLPSIKERAIKAKEEERIRRENEQAEQERHLEEKRKEQEQVQNLIEQNKRIREEKLRLEEETSSLMEEIHNTKRHYDIELEKKELEKQAELQTLKNNATIKELIDQDTNIRSNYDLLREQIREEIEASKQEQQKFLELISEHQNNIEIEKQNIEEAKQLLENQIQVERQKLQIERELIGEERENYKYALDYEKDIATLMKSELESEYKNVLEQQKLSEQIIDSRVKQLELDAIEIEQKMSNIISERNLVEEEKENISYLLDSKKEQQQNIIADSLESIESTNEKIQKQVIGNLQYDNVSIEDLVSIMNELDPEEVYTSLTSGEIDENNFPVEKAVVWFSALKKAMDNK